MILPHLVFPDLTLYSNVILDKGVQESESDKRPSLFLKGFIELCQATVKPLFLSGRDYIISYKLLTDFL